MLRPPTQRAAAGLVVALAALLAAAPPTPAAAQGATGRTMVVLPLDVGQGAITNAGRPTPYTASVKLHAALGIGTGGPIRVGPVAGVRYANPDWALAGGLRIQWLPLRFGLGGRRWGFGLAAEQLWDTADGRPAGLGVVADLELVRLAVWLVHDAADERTGFELAAGTGLRSLWAVLFPTPDDVPFDDIP